MGTGQGMKLEEVAIDVEQLSPGMYVCRLDRPWTDAPFPLQGFFVGADGEELAWVRKYCQVVWVDTELGAVPSAPRHGGVRASTPAVALPDPGRAAAPAKPRARPVVRAARTTDRLIGKEHYANIVGFEEELPKARKAHEGALQIAKQALQDAHDTRSLVFGEVTAAAEAIVESVLRNADTMFWVNALQRHGSYAYRHAINCCALAAAFGRHLGLPAAVLVDLAAGGLLLDIGKTRLPPAALQHPGPLDDDGLALVRSHVSHGLDILAEAQGGCGPPVEEMLRTHHECWDGSGYPEGLKGHDIPLFGRMAAIIDSFEAMTSVRPHLPARARHEALQELYRNRGSLYHGELVEQFTGCLGVYPTGSLVELSTGEVAVVMTQNPTRRLRPVVMLLTDAAKAPLHPFRPLDLMALEDRSPMAAAASIARPLPVGAFGLDPSELFL